MPYTDPQPVLGGPCDGAVWGFIDPPLSAVHRVTPFGRNGPSVVVHTYTFTGFAWLYLGAESFPVWSGGMPK